MCDVAVGIDVGLTGGAVVMSKDRVFMKRLLPVRPFPKGGVRGVKNRIDALALHSILSMYGISVAYVEDPGIMTKGSLAAASLHNSFGTVLSVLEVLEIPVVLIRPGGRRGWKTVYGLDQLSGLSDTEKKHRSLFCALELIPDIAPLLKKEHGVAEAALIARYGLNYLPLNQERVNA